ncbi:hypothetical protein COB72_03340 [bacterium]|nr:MAG: hypothetical protein COB72_03340 [bacterium]
MKATKLMTKAMTRDEITNTPRFDSKRVESLVLDELNIARNDLTDFAYNSPKVRLARVVIARIMTQHCGRFGRSETACRDAIAKQIGMRTDTRLLDLTMALGSGQLIAAAEGLGFKSAFRFEAYIIGMLELTKGEVNVE